MNNTNKNSILKNKKTRRALIISGCITLFSLLQLYSSKTLNKNNDDNYQNYNTESSTSNIDEMIESEDFFDSFFENIYNKDTIKIGDKEYELNKLLILKNKDGKVHLKETGGENIDILTNEAFVYDSNIICSFKDSSSFYELYLIHLLDKDGIKDPEFAAKIIKSWDGEKHYKIGGSLVEKEINDEINKRMGI